MAAPKGNLFALGCSTSGAPPKYKQAEEVRIKCAEYFDYCRRKKEPLTITGLALFLGFAARQSIYDLGKRKEFSYVIKMATMMVENGYEKRLSGQNSTGAIFALKNMGWKDRAEIENINTNINSEPLKVDQIKDISKALENDL